MKLVSNSAFVLLLTVTAVHAEGDQAPSPAILGAMSEMCGEGDSAKTDEIETRLLRNMLCRNDVADDKRLLAHHKHSRDPEVRRSYDEEFNRYMSEVKGYSKEEKAEICELVLHLPTPCQERGRHINPFR
jgi:hypothetical protein